MSPKDCKICLFLLLFFLPQLSFLPKVYSASETIYASYKYTMGDNDTKNDAKRICFLEAKRLAIEKAGTYIESTTEIKNFQLTMDEIRTFAGAIVKVDITSEEIKFIGENPTIFMTVKAEVDIESFQERVKEIKGDRELEKKIKEQQAQLQTMENKVKDLQKQLTAKDPDEVIKVRRERKEAFETIDELEKIKLDIRTATKEATENIELGMTLLEVFKVFGEPRSVDYNNDGERRYNYGNVWVIFESGVVSCIVKAKRFQRHNSCSWYSANFPSDVVK
jgi:Skp family chaperone for outer membrane proteins